MIFNSLKSQKMMVVHEIIQKTASKTSHRTVQLRYSDISRPSQEFRYLIIRNQI